MAGPLATVVHDYLTARGHDWELDEEADAFLLEADVGIGVDLPIAILPLEEEQQLVVYASAPFLVEEDQRPAVACYLADTNYQLAIGNLEMDLDDGEVRFRTSADVTGSVLTDVLVDRLLQACVVQLAGLLDPLAEVAAGRPPAEG